MTETELIKKYSDIAVELAGKNRESNDEPYYDPYMGRVGVALAPATMDMVTEMTTKLKELGWVEVDNQMSADPSYVAFKYPTERIVAVIEYVHFFRTEEEKYLNLWVGLNDDDIDYFEEPHECKCPLGGDETDDCAGCPYAGDHHFVNGECVVREDDDYNYAEMQSMADQVDGVPVEEEEEECYEAIPMIPCIAP